MNKTVGTNKGTPPIRRTADVREAYRNASTVAHLIKMPTPVVKSMLQKFSRVESDRAAHIWGPESNGGVRISKPELKAFIRWARLTGLTLSPVRS